MNDLQIMKAIMVFQTVVLFTLLWPSHLIYAEVLCDGRILGRPLVDDCAYALSSIEGAKGGSTLSTVERRLFIEPQYLGPPFHKISPNPFDNTIVQIPKIWRHGKALGGHQFPNASRIIQCT